MILEPSPPTGSLVFRNKRTCERLIFGAVNLFVPFSLFAVKSLRLGFDLMISTR